MLPLLLCQQKEIDNWEMNCYKESSQKQTQVQLALEVIFAHLKQYKRPRKCKRHKKVDDLTIGKAPLILIKHFFDFWICFQLHNDELCDEKKSKVDQQHKEGLSIRYLDIRRNPKSQCLCSCHLFKAQRIELQLKSHKPEEITVETVKYCVEICVYLLRNGEVYQNVETRKREKVDKSNEVNGQRC